MPDLLIDPVLWAERLGAMSDKRLSMVGEEFGFAADDWPIQTRVLPLSVARIIHKHLTFGASLFAELQKLSDVIEESAAQLDEIEALEALYWGAHDAPDFNNEGSNDHDR